MPNFKRLKLCRKHKATEGFSFSFEDAMSTSLKLVLPGSIFISKLNIIPFCLVLSPDFTWELGGLGNFEGEVQTLCKMVLSSSITLGVGLSSRKTLLLVNPGSVENQKFTECSRELGEQRAASVVQFENHLRDSQATRYLFELRNLVPRRTL